MSYFSQFNNITNEDDFWKAIALMRKHDTWVVDTETNGLNYRRNHHIISISVYLPDIDTCFNFPFYHGVGEVLPDYDPTEPIIQNGWDKSAKQRFTAWAWERYKETEPDFGNLPVHLLEHLKGAFSYCKRMIMHNARFDMHMLDAMGFPIPAVVEDTMLLLYVVNEDWNRIKFDGDNGKKQSGSRALKWQADFWGLPQALEGEQELDLAIEALRSTMATVLYLYNFHASEVDSLLYSTMRKAVGTGKPPIVHKMRGSQEERFASKIHIDKKANMWMLPSKDVALYAMLDVRLTWLLRQEVYPIIERWGADKFYHHLCAVQREVAFVMETNGFTIDVELAEQMIEEMKGKQQAIEDILKEAANDPEFKVNSPAQLKEFLTRYMAGEIDYDFAANWFRVGFLGGYTFEAELQFNDDGEITGTDREALEAMPDNPVTTLVLQYRKLGKAIKTYLANWLKVRDKKNVVRGRMNVDGTVAGRLSSSGDAGNMQNIPTRGYTIKRAIVPPNQDWLLFGIDYGQLEARLASWYAEVLWQPIHNMKPVMLDLFESGADMHVYTRDLVGVHDILWGDKTDLEILTMLGREIKPDSDLAAMVATEARQVAKTLNFGLLYSGGARMVSKLLKIDYEKAQVLVDRWRGLFPVFGWAQDYCTRNALEWRLVPNDNEQLAQYVTYGLGSFVRQRKFHKYPERDYFLDDNGNWRLYSPKEAAARKAWNNIVQGTGGLIAMDAAMNINREIGNDKIRMFANIHDAIDGYVHRSHIDKLKDAMYFMTNYDIRPALTVDLEVGLNWQDMKKMSVQQAIEMYG